jgi:hypothetical protein
MTRQFVNNNVDININFDNSKSKRELGMEIQAAENYHGRHDVPKAGRCGGNPKGVEQIAPIQHYFKPSKYGSTHNRSMRGLLDHKGHPCLDES